MYGGVKIVINVLKIMCDLPKSNMWCAVMKNTVSPFYFEEHLVTGNKFLATIEETALHHILAGTVFKLEGAPSHFSHCIHGFLGREFPDHWKGRRTPISWTLSSLHLILLDFTLLEVCKRQRRKMSTSCVTEQFELQSVSLMKRSPVRGITNGVHIEIYRANKKSSEVQSLKMYLFLLHTS
jgi:hypothetical protein